MKYYENLKVVYQIQTLLRDWQQQQAEDPKAAKSSEPKTDDRKLPVKTLNPGGAPAANPSSGAPRASH
jgi:septal ring-binding cell division protein DamX